MRIRFYECLCGILCALMAFTPVSGMADVMLVINTSGAFRVDTSANPPTVTPIPADRIVIDSAVGVPGPTPKDPDDPNPQPPTDDLTQKIVDASKLHLKSEKEARALIATFKLLSDLAKKGSLKQEQINAAVTASLPVISSQLSSGTRLKDWYAAVTAAAGGMVTGEVLDKSVNALAFAWKVDAARMALQLKSAGDRIADGASIGSAAESVTGDTAEALDIGTILMIIQAIMELLKAIGIIGG